MKNSRGLVISGGGSKGAYGGGVIECLATQNNIKWDGIYGCSTGSLLAMLVSVDRIDELKHIYTSLSHKDIFSVNPFNKYGKIDKLNALCRIVQGKTSLGETENLYRLIKEYFPNEYFEESKSKKLKIAVSNYTTGKVEFIYNRKSEYEDFIKSIYASASVPIFSDLVKIGNCFYADGGVIENVPIQTAINDGLKEIDVIINRVEKRPLEDKKLSNMWDVFNRTVELMEREISDSDISIGSLIAKTQDVKLNFHYAPYNLTNNLLMFNKEQTAKWWDLGYEYTLNKPIKSVILKKS